MSVLLRKIHEGCILLWPIQGSKNWNQVTSLSLADLDFLNKGNYKIKSYSRPTVTLVGRGGVDTY
jgi:hypothetical protein